MTDDARPTRPDVRERSATVVDVARLAGVSATTVSNYANHPDRLRDATAARVEEARADLGYEVNDAGRLLGRRTRAAPTIRDVARVAGVSYQTVSRALNRPEHVRPATAERVAAAIRQLRFVADPAARALQQRVGRRRS
jgi:DNA-binding LacI/PurR family transcriptional regulator